MRRKFIYQFLLFSAIQLGCCMNNIFAVDSNETKFSSANTLFQKQDYDGAIKEYSELIKSDSSSAEVWFNLGNSFFRKLEYAQAIICFERAKRISPSDEDVNFNLRMSNLHISDKIDPLPRIFYLRWIDDLSFLFSISQWSLVIVILFFLMIVLVLGYFLFPSIAMRKISFFSGMLMLILVGLSYALVFHQQHLLHGTERAVITTASVYVKSSPDEKGTDLFILHEGTSVEVLDELNGWKKVRIANGNIGWVLNNTFEVI